MRRRCARRERPPRAPPPTTTSKGASRLGLGRGLLLGLGLGLRLRLGWRRGALGRRSRSRSYAARRILSRVISSFDDWSLACGGARRRGGGFSALSSSYLNSRERESSWGLTSSCRVSRTAVSFCCRRIALTMAACFSALTAMSARRRDSLTSARSCEGAEVVGRGLQHSCVFEQRAGGKGRSTVPSRCGARAPGWPRSDAAGSPEGSSRPPVSAAAASARARAYHLEARRRRFARKDPSRRLLTQSCS